MRRLIKVRELLVHAIYRKCILDQIVRSNTEEIHLGCERVGTDRRAWNFDHRANLDLFPQRDTRPAQFVLTLSEYGLGAA